MSVSLGKKQGSKCLTRCPGFRRDQFDLNLPYVRFDADPQCRPDAMAVWLVFDNTAKRFAGHVRVARFVAVPAFIYHGSKC